MKIDHEFKDSKSTIWEDYRGEKEEEELCDYIPISNNRKVTLDVGITSITKGCAYLSKFTRKVKEVSLEQQLYEICMFPLLNIYKYILFTSGNILNILFSINQRVKSLRKSP